jgi:hypothetical protein
VSDYLLKSYLADISSSHRAAAIAEVHHHLARTIPLYFMRQFPKRQVFYWLRKAHPHPGKPEQIGALLRITRTLRERQ